MVAAAREPGGMTRGEPDAEPENFDVTFDIVRLEFLSSGEKSD
jgi:hypothetical protein